ATVFPDAGKPSGATKRPKFIREKDLKGHIENDNGQQLEESEEVPEVVGVDSEGDVKEEKGKKDDKKPADELTKDRQLHTALMLLKGVNVFGNLKKD
ncbi:MAG: hypothetical protein OEV91_10335, partial [Desulfobulbaceae bacterium]|nr:hypothetical protein [Desulfobulbaceae bacterium]